MGHTRQDPTKVEMDAVRALLQDSLTRVMVRPVVRTMLPTMAVRINFVMRVSSSWSAALMPDWPLFAVNMLSLFRVQGGDISRAGTWRMLCILRFRAT